MRWSVWLPAVWGGLSVVAALVLGAVAAKARVRERALRRRQYETESRRSEPHGKAG